MLRILETKIRMGLFEHPYSDDSYMQKVLHAPESLEAARKVVQHSVILLRNENKALPLDSKKIRSIAVIGPLADGEIDLLGMWGSMNKLGPTVSVVQEIRNKVGSGIKVEFDQGPNIYRDIPSFFENLPMVPMKEQPKQIAEEVR